MSSNKLKPILYLVVITLLVLLTAYISAVNNWYVSLAIFGVLSLSLGFVTAIYVAVTIIKSLFKYE